MNKFRINKEARDVFAWYYVQEQKFFLGLIPYWKDRAKCDTLTEAREFLAYTKEQDE